MEVETVMVTGANRGIGLEFVKQLTKLPKPPRFVFATYRNRDTVKALEDIRDLTYGTQVVLVQMDITKVNDIQTTREIVEELVGESGLNILINNAGTMNMQGFSQITEENLLFHFTTNAVGPVLLFKEMYPLLQKSAARKSMEFNVSRAAVLNITSIGGSLSHFAHHPEMFLEALGYRTSKAALNMAMMVAALTVKDQGILVVSMCPGWVKTDMGSAEACVEVSDSISAMLKTLPQLNESHQGAFLDRFGKTIPF